MTSAITFIPRLILAVFVVCVAFVVRAALVTRRA